MAITKREPKPVGVKPIYPYTLTQIRERGESIVYRVFRADKPVLWFDPRNRLYDIAREVVHYLNRDRREIVLVEDRMALAERRLEEVSKLCGLLIVNLHWCVDQVPPEHRKLVDGWSEKGRKLLAEIMEEKWK